MEKSPVMLKYLRAYDLVVLTVIMFGYFILVSNWMYLGQASTGQDSLAVNALDFTPRQNWQAMQIQLVFLLLAGLYLYWRKFDFSQWQLEITLKGALQGLALFLGVALAFDLYYMALSWLSSPASLADLLAAYPSLSFGQALAGLDVSLVIYSLFNGFYEEIFFLGICMSVPPEKRPLAFIYSLLVRYAFHSYQGQATAIGISLIVGGVYYGVYTWMGEESLFPFMLSHSLADMFGLGILTYFF